MHRTHYKNKIQPYKPLDKQVQWERRKIQQLQSSSLEELWLIPQSALYKYIYTQYVWKGELLHKCYNFQQGDE